MNSKTGYSLEFFPPRSDEATRRLEQILPRLPRLEPDFVTVTYKSTPSGHSRTMDTVFWIQEKTGIPTAAHMTFFNLRKEDIKDCAGILYNKGIRHIVALRGDLPGDYDQDDYPKEHYYRYTSEFVSGLRELHDFEISVAAYPEKHPDADSLEADIEALKRKCDAGATRAITQFFFDNDVYYRFLEKVEKQGIKQPVVPGILPIANFEKTLRFARNCQANVPDWIIDKYEAHKGDPAYLSGLSEEILLDQCRDLMENEAGHIHFYTLNHWQLLLKVLRALKV